MSLPLDFVIILLHFTLFQVFSRLTNVDLLEIGGKDQGDQIFGHVGGLFTSLMMLEICMHRTELQSWGKWAKRAALTFKKETLRRNVWGKIGGSRAQWVA